MRRLQHPPLTRQGQPDWTVAKSFWPNAETSEFYALGDFIWHVQRDGIGPLALLLHGTGASTHSMAPLSKELSGYYSTLSIDLPGHGFTRSPVRFEPSLPNVCRAISDLLAKLNAQPELIIGHSAGAAIALQIGEAAPSPPSGIASINGALQPFDGVMGLIAPATAKLFTIGGLAANALAQSARNPARVRRLVEDTGSVISDRAIRQYAFLMQHPAHIQGTLKLMAHWKLTHMKTLCSRLDLPILFLTGARDRAVSPTTSRDISNFCSSGKHVSLTDYGHLVHEEAPDEVSRYILDWAAKKNQTAND